MVGVIQSILAPFKTDIAFLVPPLEYVIFSALSEVPCLAAVFSALSDSSI